MEKKQRQKIHLTFKPEDPNHAKAWLMLMQNKGTGKYPTAADYVSAAILHLEEDVASEGNQGNISDTDKQELCRILADEIENRIKPILRGTIGR